MTGPAADRITVDGVTLESRWAGPRPGEAPTIVLLPEGPGSVGRWGTFPDELSGATGCGVFAWSRAGDEQSHPAIVPPPPADLDDQAFRTLPAVLAAIGFERGVLLGHAAGASVATLYAGGVQDHRVRGLVLIAPRFFEEGATKSGTRDIRESLGYIRVPILIVQGTTDQDDSTAQIEVAREETYCPVDAALIEGAGQAPHHERPAETIRAVVSYLDDLLVTMGEAARPVAGEAPE